jgi:hypothetical protein
VKTETKKDLLGKYLKISYSNGRIEIVRFFKELGMSVKIVEKYETN